MDADEVTLGEWALKICARLGISPNDVKKARAGQISSYEVPEYLVVIGQLETGMLIRMMCQVNRPNHIVTLRPS